MSLNKGLREKIEKIMGTWYQGKGLYDIEGIAFDLEELIDEECYKDRQALKKEIMKARPKKWMAEYVKDYELSVGFNRALQEFSDAIKGVLK